ncbi:MAG: YfcE family phosphodiesterase, partial [Methanomassiliicoccales archaeon]|nr:YfcE family phosphodiesterase [Methanomassiliicoccales archaeon]
MSRDALCSYGRMIANERLTALLAEVDGVRAGEDIEHVHRMRVASRRLRSALRLFRECFKGKSGKRWRQAAKEVTTSLGEARDLDVQIAFLSKLKKDWEGEDGRALIPIIEMLRSQRVALHPNIVALMDALTTEHPLLELKVDLDRSGEPTGEVSALCPYAFAHASIAVEEMMSHASSVPIYEDWQGHHALRIAGKHLRYALEAFRNAYEDKLEEEVRTLKRLQDVVGELHDCDVWLQKLTTMREERPQGSTAIDRLQRELVERRHEQHRKLVESWCELQQDRFFYRLLEKMKGRSTEEVCPLKVALISDVHGNEAALRAVLAHARERGVTAILHAGDAVGAPWSDRSIDLLKGADVLSVCGNLDRTALAAHHTGKRTGDPQLDLVIDSMKERSWEWLTSLPQDIRLDICGRTIFMTHAAPGEMEEKLLPSTPDARLKAIAKNTRADVIVTGHSHVPMCREVARGLFVNPGSVGRPRDGPEASYAIMDFPSLELRHHR